MNDERNAASGSFRADLADRGEESLAAPPPLHAPQQARRRVLQRQVEVRHDGRQLEHRRHRAGRAPRTDRGRAAGCASVRRPRAGRGGAAAATIAPGSPVSRPYHARSCATSTISRDALLDERARFGLDRLWRTRPLRAAERRDRAERARAVAAFGDLHVRPRRRRRGPRQLQADRAHRSACASSTTSASAPSPANPTTASASGSAAASSSP